VLTRWTGARKFAASEVRPQRAERVLALASGVTALLFGALALAGCGSAHSTGVPTAVNTSSPPAWARTLGSSVTVTAPTAVSPGYGSPGAAVLGALRALGSGRASAACRYLAPSIQAQCQPAMGSASDSASGGLTLKNLTLGYVAIDGSKALVGTTGTLCLTQSDVTPARKCMSNRNPAAVFSAGKPFSALWSATLTDANSDPSTTSFSYTLMPAVEVGHRWYFYFPPGGI
jgi:hypothetical protein